MRTDLSDNFDIIGDIHGHLDELEKLLRALGYEVHDGCYRHPQGRRVIFVGDLLDRGPEIRATVRLAKDMHEDGQAMVILGNHEYNAVCFCSEDEGGISLREHSDKNIEQFRQTLDSYAAYPDEWQGDLEWFKTLPLFLDLGEFRVVHACWSQKHIDVLKNVTLGDERFLRRSATPGTPEYWAVETVLKGAEITLPEGICFADKAGHIRTKTRVKWWHPIENLTYRSASYPEQPALPDEPVAQRATVEPWDIYADEDVPVFCGHYWLPPGTPEIDRNVVCLDYSVALGGFAAAYRWEPGMGLRNDQFVTSLDVELIKGP